MMPRFQDVLCILHPHSANDRESRFAIRGATRLERGMVVRSVFKEKNGPTLGMGLLAFAVVALWGLTFVSFDVTGKYFTPAQIMFLRCVIAYISLWVIYPRFHKPESLKTEALLFFAGATGTTLYVMLTNYALKFADASVVSVISSLSPIFTALLLPLFFRGSKISARVLVGFVIALFGATLVSTGGKLDFSSEGGATFVAIGALLALGSAVTWACYTLLLRHLKSSQYSQTYVTRRVFLYGIVCVAPYLIFFDQPLAWENLLIPEAFLNLLFLGLVAYTFCHVGWGIVTRNKGSVWASQFTYITPVATMVGAAIILGDVITGIMIAGTALILIGVMIADGTIVQKLKGKSMLGVAGDELGIARAEEYEVGSPGEMKEENA